MCDGRKHFHQIRRRRTSKDVDAIWKINHRFYSWLNQFYYSNEIISVGFSSTSLSTIDRSIERPWHLFSEKWIISLSLLFLVSKTIKRTFIYSWKNEQAAQLVLILFSFSSFACSLSPSHSPFISSFSDNWHVTISQSLDNIQWIFNKFFSHVSSIHWFSLN